MFNWLGNLFPYSDLHSLNLDWLLSKMKETATQAAQAIADSAKALAQVIEAKTAAQNAQTAANNAADSAENAVNVAQAARSAAQTAQNTANTAQSAAQTAQSAAQTAQSAAETAQSTADTANTGVEALNARFPVKRNDIASEAINSSKIESYSISPNKLVTDASYVYLDKSSVSHLKFPESGSATYAEISAGVMCTNTHFLKEISQFFQVKIDILESGSSSTVFKCESYPAVRINTTDTIVMLPFTIFNNNTNAIYDGFVKITSAANQFTCKVIFKTEPSFNANTEFVIDVYPLHTKLSQQI